MRQADWPHAVGNSWTYDRVHVEWVSQADKRRTESVRFELGAAQFVPGGVEVQPLTVVAANALGPALEAQFAVARPDLARRHAVSSRGSGSGVVIHDAGLVRFASLEIAAYAADGTRRWLYLEADRSAGQRFSMPLTSDPADSVVLYGTVVGTADVSTPAGSFDAALRVRYTVDYGWVDVVDPQGQRLGRVRSVTRGEMFYAPDVGPVLARETFVAQGSTQGSPPPPPTDSTFTELRLQSYDVHPTALEPVDWSVVKQRYR